MTTGTPYCFGDGSGADCPCGADPVPGRGCPNSGGAGARLDFEGDGFLTDSGLSILSEVVVPGESGREEPWGNEAATEGEARPIDNVMTVMAGRKHPTPVFERDDLSRGGQVEGPAIIIEANSTTVVEPGWTVTYKPRPALEDLDAVTRVMQTMPLRQLATAEVMPAVAVTEPDYGSDVAGIKVTATPAPGPNGEDGWVINGVKTFISNAGIAGLLTVLARSSEAEGAEALSMFLVDAEAPEGVEVPEPDRRQLVAPRDPSRRRLVVGDDEHHLKPSAGALHRALAHHAAGADLSAHRGLTRHHRLRRVEHIDVFVQCQQHQGHGDTGAHQQKQNDDQPRAALGIHVSNSLALRSRARACRRGTRVGTSEHVPSCSAAASTRRRWRRAPTPSPPSDCA